MRKVFTAIVLAILLPIGFSVSAADAVYKWVDKEGVLHYGDRIPAEYAEVEKKIINEMDITVSVVRGKRTDAEKAADLAEDQRKEELAKERKLQKRDDAALLATYRTIDEITMHRERRVELFQAQARVTDLYLRNIRRRLVSLMDVGENFRPYNRDPNAEMIGAELAGHIENAKSTIARHEDNLARFSSDEKNIVARFEQSISRFKALKGITD